MPLTESVRLDVAQAEAAIAALKRQVESLSSVQQVSLTAEPGAAAALNQQLALFDFDASVNFDADQGSFADVERQLAAYDFHAEVELEVDDRPLRTIDERLDSIEANVEDVNRDVSDIAVNAGQASVEFQKLAQTLGVSETEARQLADQILTADRAARQIDDSARAVARELGLADDDARRFANEMGKASRETRETGQAMDRVAAGAGRLRVAIIGAVAAFGVRGLVRFADQAIDSYNALNESVNAVNVVFEEGAAAVLKFGETSAQSALLSQSAFQQAVVPIGALLRNFGFDANQAADAAVVLTQRAADLASVFNTDVNEALDAIASGLRGEANPLERFGAGISAARVEAFALSSGLASTKAEIDDLIRVQARYQLILEDTAKVQGDVARTADDPANAARRLAEEAENARAALGESLIPAYLEILRVTPDVIAAFEEVGPAVGLAASAVSGSAEELAGALVATLNVLARFPAAFEILAIQAQTLPVNLAGIASDIASTVPVLGEVFAIGSELVGLTDRLADRNERLAAVYARLDLITSLQAGIDPLSALVGALDQLASEGGDVADELERLARVAGFTGVELLPVLQGIINESARFRLSADEVALLRFQIALLKDELTLGGPTDFTDLIPDLSGLDAEIDDGIVTLRELQAAAREAGVSLAEAFSDPEIFAAGTVFDVFAQAEAQVANFRDRVNQIGREIDPLKGATEQLDISRAEFIANLQEAFEQEVGFEANLARLANRGFDALADRLRQLGPGAATLAEEFLGNVADATVANDVFDASANRVATGLSDALREEFRGSLFTGLPSELARTLAQAFDTDPGTGFDSLAEKQARQINQGLRAPAARSEFEAGGRESAEEVTSAFADEVERLAPDVGYDAALDIARALTTGESAAAAEQAGIDWARLFSAAVAANVSFDFQAPNIPTPSGGFADPGTLGGPGTPVRGGNQFTFNIETAGGDLPSTLAQVEQAAQTIGVLLT